MNLKQLSWKKLVNSPPIPSQDERESVCVCVCVKLTQLCPNLRPHELYSPWNSPGQSTGVGSLSLLHRIFPTHGWNPGLPRCRRIL